MIDTHLTEKALKLSYKPVDGMAKGTIVMLIIDLICVLMAASIPNKIVSKCSIIFWVLMAVKHYKFSKKLAEEYYKVKKGDSHFIERV